MAAIVICNCCGAHVEQRDAGYRDEIGYWYCASCMVDGECHRCHVRMAARAPTTTEEG